MTGSPYPEWIVVVFATILIFLNLVQVVANWRARERKDVNDLTKLFHVALALASGVLLYSAVTLSLSVAGVKVVLALASNELIAFIGVVLLSRQAHITMIVAKKAIFKGRVKLSPLYGYALWAANVITAISWFTVMIIMGTVDNDTRYKSIPFLLTATTMLILIAIVSRESFKLYQLLKESERDTQGVRGSQSVLTTPHHHQTSSFDLTRAPTGSGSPPEKGHHTRNSSLPRFRLVPSATAPRAPPDAISSLKWNAGLIIAIASIVFVWITYSGIRKAQETGHHFYSPDSKTKSSLFNAFITHIVAMAAISLGTWLKWDRTGIPIYKWKAELYYPQIEQNGPAPTSPEVGGIGLAEIDEEAPPIKEKIDIPIHDGDRKGIDAERNEEAKQDESSTSGDEG